MKKIIFYITFALFFASHASAQTTYSFSGLSWGDPIEVVDSKLKSAGFSGCRLQDKLMCKLATTCMCEFNGPATGGHAELVNGKLEKVRVYANWSESIDILTKKYGPPITRPDPPYTGGLVKLNMDRDWESRFGETIELIHGTYSSDVIYKSGDRNRRAQSQDRANKSVF